MSDFEAIFTEHIHALERHAVLLSEAAEHFRAVPRVFSNIAEVQEVQNMKLRAQQSLLDARRCQQLFLECDQNEKASQASHLQEVKGPPKRARDAEQAPGGAKQLQMGNVKRRRVDRPVMEEDKHDSRPASPLTIDDIRRAKLRGKLRDKFGPRFDADPWIPDWGPTDRNRMPKNTLVEIDEIVAEVEAWMRAECENIVARSESRMRVEYDDISAEVEARIRASDKRRKENSGELEKKAVKRSWNDRNSTGNTEYVGADESDLHRAEKRSRRRIGETFMDWSARQAYEATAST